DEQDRSAREVYQAVRDGAEHERSRRRPVSADDDEVGVGLARDRIEHIRRLTSARHERPRRLVITELASDVALDVGGGTIEDIAVQRLTDLIGHREVRVLGEDDDESTVEVVDQARRETEGPQALVGSVDPHYHGSHRYLTRSGSRGRPPAQRSWI